MVCFYLGSHIFEDERRLSRPSLIKNAKRCDCRRDKEYLVRGDVRNASRIGGTKFPRFRSTDWSSCTELISRESRTVRTRKPKNKRFTLFKKGTARLRCAEGTFRVHNIYGDGNCMFRAISYILWRNEDEHRHLRTMVRFIFPGTTSKSYSCASASGRNLLSHRDVGTEIALHRWLREFSAETRFAPELDAHSNGGGHKCSFREEEKLAGIGPRRCTSIYSATVSHTSARFSQQQSLIVTIIYESLRILIMKHLVNVVKRSYTDFSSNANRGLKINARCSPIGLQGT
nr:uncharacterized protein LOC117224248 isoform X1 [Megalopta genalis]